MTSHLPLSNRSALITGAASGIGAACARHLAAQGAGKLVLVDVDEAGLAALDLPCEVTRITGSVADPDLWEGLRGELVGLDHAVVNAGIARGFGGFAEQELDDWNQVVSVNLTGAFLTLRAAMQAMRDANGGSIVVTSSITAVKPVPGTGAYGVTKAGVAHMARIAAGEGAPDNIRVNAIAPGAVDTAIWEGSDAFRQMEADAGRHEAMQAMATGTPRGTYATADEIAATIGFLLSDAAANITGHVLASDGGYSL